MKESFNHDAKRVRFHALANPARFFKVARFVSPFLYLGFFGFLGTGLYYSLLGSPPDYQQGDTVRIMYVHVPAAYLAVMIYGFMAMASASLLIWKHPLAEMAARAAAPIGLCFTFLCLATGSLWGKPMWGTWWVWDARLTSVLILFFLYIGYIALTYAFDEPGRGSKPAAILALVGVVNLPIIKFSVDWWNTLHQPAALIRLDGPTIAPEMLIPLFLMMAGFTCFFGMILLWRMHLEFNRAKLRNYWMTASSWRLDSSSHVSVASESLIKQDLAPSVRGE